MKSLLISFLFLFAGTRHKEDFKLIYKSDYKNISIEVYKNASYKGKSLENLYRMQCMDIRKKAKREFYIGRTNHELKEKTMANYFMFEYNSTGEKSIYPFMWETDKIEINDMKENCSTIMDNKARPVEL